MLSSADILSALRDCYDPVLPCNIVDLGLVRELTLAPDPAAPGAGIPGVPPPTSVRLLIAAASTADDATAQLTAHIRNRLAGIEAISHVEVILATAPPWSPSDISPAGRRTLGLEGNPSLVQIR